MTGEEIGGYGTGVGALAMLGIGLRWLLFTFIPSVTAREDAVFTRLESQGTKFTGALDAVEKSHALAMDKVSERLGEISHVVAHCPHNSCPLGLNAKDSKEDMGLGVKDVKTADNGRLQRTGPGRRDPGEATRKDQDKEA